MADKRPQFSDDLVTFDSAAGLRQYLKELLDHYKSEVDRYGSIEGELMREILKRDAVSRPPTKGKKSQPSPWQKVGSLMVNTTDQLLGKNEVNLQLLHEYTYKLKGTTEAIRATETLDQFNLAGSTSMILYLNDGVPERIIIEYAGGTPKSD